MRRTQWVWSTYYKRQLCRRHNWDKISNGENNHCLYSYWRNKYQKTKNNSSLKSAFLPTKTLFHYFSSKYILCIFHALYIQNTTNKSNKRMGMTKRHLQWPNQVTEHKIKKYHFSSTNQTETSPTASLSYTISWKTRRWFLGLVSPVPSRCRRRFWYAPICGLRWHRRQGNALGVPSICRGIHRACSRRPNGA